MKPFWTEEAEELFKNLDESPVEELDLSFESPNFKTPPKPKVGSALAILNKFGSYSRCGFARRTRTCFRETRASVLRKQAISSNILHRSTSKSNLENIPPHSTPNASQKQSKDRWAAMRAISSSRQRINTSTLSANTSRSRVNSFTNGADRSHQLLNHSIKSISRKINDVSIRKRPLDPILKSFKDSQQCIQYSNSKPIENNMKTSTMSNNSSIMAGFKFDRNRKDNLIDMFRPQSKKSSTTTIPTAKRPPSSALSLSKQQNIDRPKSTQPTTLPSISNESVLIKTRSSVLPPIGRAVRAESVKHNVPGVVGDESIIKTRNIPWYERLSKRIHPLYSVKEELPYSLVNRTPPQSRLR
ncbi:hypothetical protein GJ496_006629 [Pomphorhynchus laevis]|nr:hypothetical protein GJ496_006629 [Pomphorhynchus laevis]